MEFKNSVRFLWIFIPKNIIINLKSNYQEVLVFVNLFGSSVQGKKIHWWFRNSIPEVQKQHTWGLHLGMRAIGSSPVSVPKISEKIEKDRKYAKDPLALKICEKIFWEKSKINKSIWVKIGILYLIVRNLKSILTSFV